MISLSVTFFICFRILFSVAFIGFTFNDRLLPNKTFESFSTIDWLQCVKACQASPRCISYNYDVCNDKSCFLNECGFCDRCEALRNLVVSPGAIFHQLKKVLNNSFCSFQSPAETKLIIWYIQTKLLILYNLQWNCEDSDD